MNKFDTSFRGYNKEQVKTYFDHVIKQYENLLNEKKAQNNQQLYKNQKVRKKGKSLTFLSKIAVFLLNSIKKIKLKYTYIYSKRACAQLNKSTS